MSPGGEDPGDGVHLAEKRPRHEHMIDRLVRGLPVIRGGRAVVPLEELLPVKWDAPSCRPGTRPGRPEFS
ncbi:hypothetical protein [Streptomyces griseorubiginosus]|uniref:hypothetical protein n=1 Tax=Streptomyces griseorubiginosus TaxID=67304 RepID=UPI0033C4F27E